MTVVEHCDPEVYRLRAIMAEAAKQDALTCRKWIRDALGSMPSVPPQPQGAVEALRDISRMSTASRMRMRAARALEELGEPVATNTGGQCGSVPSPSSDLTKESNDG